MRLTHLPYREKIIAGFVQGAQMERTTYLVAAAEDLGKLSMSSLYYSGHETLEAAEKEYNELMKKPLDLPKEGGGQIELLWVIIKATVKIERLKP